MSIKAMKLALEVLTFDGFTPQDVTHRELTAKAVEAFRTAIQQAESEPVAWIYQNEDLVWERFENIDGPSNEYTPLYTHSAPGVPEDVAQDAQRYRWLRRKACVIGKTTYCGEETGQPILDFVNLPDVTEVIRRDSASTLDAAIDAAMLAAKDASA